MTNPNVVVCEMLNGGLRMKADTWKNSALLSYLSEQMLHRHTEIIDSVICVTKWRKAVEHLIASGMIAQICRLANGASTESLADLMRLLKHMILKVTIVKTPQPTCDSLFMLLNTTLELSACKRDTLQACLQIVTLFYKANKVAECRMNSMSHTLIAHCMTQSGTEDAVPLIWFMFQRQSILDYKNVNCVVFQNLLHVSSVSGFVGDCARNVLVSILMRDKRFDDHVTDAHVRGIFELLLRRQKLTSNLRFLAMFIYCIYGNADSTNVELCDLKYTALYEAIILSAGNSKCKSHHVSRAMLMYTIQFPMYEAMYNKGGLDTKLQQIFSQKYGFLFRLENANIAELHNIHRLGVKFGVDADFLNQAISVRLQKEETERQEHRLDEVGIKDFTWPSEFICPITMDRMLEPVVASDGHSYEKTAITRHLKINKRSPLTREPINARLIPNRNLKRRIEEHIDDICALAAKIKRV